MAERAVPVASLASPAVFGWTIVAGCALSVLAAAGNLDAFSRGWLAGFAPWWLVTVGAMGLICLGNLTGGAWIGAERTPLSAAVAALPVVAIGVLPVALNLNAVYPWAPQDAAVRESFTAGKGFYLSRGFFLWRAAGYFIAWAVVAWMLRRTWFEDHPPAATESQRRWAAIALILLLPTVTFAGFDWGMSLEPQWYSSIYGGILALEGVYAAHAMAIVALTTGDKAARRGPSPSAVHSADAAEKTPAARDEVDINTLHDLGNLMLAFVIVCAYFAFSQWLIIWSGNLPSEISWYLRRSHPGWLLLGGAVLLLHFVVPFAALLSRQVKRTPAKLNKVAWLALATLPLRIYWLIAPAFDSRQGWLLAAAAGGFATIGGAWAYLFDRHMRAQDSAPAASEEGGRS